MNQRIKRILPVVFCWLFFCLLAFFFIPECDDLYFEYWDFASVADFFGTTPIQADAAGVPQNGRYLGNALGVVMSKLLRLGLPGLRALFLGSCLFLFCLLTGSYGEAKDRSRRILLGFAALTLCPVILWQEVLSWSASFCNYLVPVLFLLIEAICFRYREPSPGMSAGLLILAFLGQLFSETMSAFTLMLSALWCLLALVKKDRPRFIAALCMLAGAALGALLMFSDPGYSALDSDPMGRSIGLSGAKATLFAVLTDTLFENILLLPLCALLFRQKFRADHRRWVRLSVSGLCLTALCCVVLSLARRMGLGVPLSIRLVLSLAAAALIFALYLALEKGETKLWMGLWAVCYLGMTAVLMLINPISPRHYFIHYVLLFLALVELYNEVRWLPVRSLLTAAAVAGLCLSFVYHANYATDCRRTVLIQEAMARGDTALTLPLVPYPQYTINETTAKGDVSFIYYYEAPWDLDFTFVPFDECNP